MSKSTPEHEFLDPEEYESWHAVLVLAHKILDRLDAGLQAAHGLSVTEFDVLITLFNADGHRLGMSALAGRVMLSPAGLTHLVTRLERDRLVRRERDPADARKSFTVLTAKGDEALRNARATHNGVLRQTLLSHTTAAERQTLRRILRRLSAGAGG